MSMKSETFMHSLYLPAWASHDVLYRTRTTWVQFEMCASAGYHMDQALPGEEAR